MHKAKKLTSIAIAALTIALGGCSSLSNLTPEKVPENASRTYTLSMSAYINDGDLIQDSIEPFIVIDEKIIPMRETSDMKYDRIYEYDYVMPKGRTEAKYYFLLKYKVSNNIEGVSKEREMKSRTVYTLKPISRYVVNLQNERGPVGTVVPVLGRGFDRLDKIYVGDVQADTEYVSRNTLNFTVPPLAAGKTYDVALVGTNSEIWVGAFRVDVANMNVSPASIELKSGDITNIIFNIGFTAPKGGYPIDVKTNIPSSVIMDEVVVPEGESSTSVMLKAAAPGKGFLYINGLGFNEKQIPIEVLESDSQEDVMNELAPAIEAADKNAAAASNKEDKEQSDKKSADATKDTPSNNPVKATKTADTKVESK